MKLNVFTGNGPFARGGPFSFGSGGGGLRPILGSDAIAWWDVARTDLLTVEAGAGAQMLDIIAGYPMVQATSGSRPAYDAEGFNGSPCLIADGTDDFMTCTDAAFLAALPAGAVGSEMWVICSQDALPADATVRNIMAYGNNSVNNSRAIARSVLSGANEASARTGTGASFVTVFDTVPDFSSRHAIRAQFNPTETIITVDNGIPVVSAAVPATLASRLRVFSQGITAAGAYWKGAGVSWLITKPLSADKASVTWAGHMDRRLGNYPEPPAGNSFISDGGEYILDADGRPIWELT